MVRNLIGILLALIAAAAAAWSPYRAWYGARLGRDYRVSELFSASGITGAQAGLWTGLFAPMLGAAVLALIAVLLRSRLLLALTGLLVAGFTILWMVRQGQDAGTLTAGEGGLADGVGYALGAGFLMVLAALVMRGRRPRGRRRKGRGGGRVDDDRAAPESAFSEQPYPYGQSGTAPGPHGAYLADEPAAYQADEQPPYERSHHPFYYDYDDSTPPEEWDPWAAGRPGPAEPPPDQPGWSGPPGEPGRRGEPPQGPQQQPPQE